MIKCEAIRNFTMHDFDKLKNIVRHDTSYNENGKVYKEDIFECSKEIAKYLSGDNDSKIVCVVVIEIIPKK